MKQCVICLVGCTHHLIHFSCLLISYKPYILILAEMESLWLGCSASERKWWTGPQNSSVCKKHTLSDRKLAYQGEKSLLSNVAAFYVEGYFSMEEHLVIWPSTILCSVLPTDRFITSAGAKPLAHLKAQVTWQLELCNTTQGSKPLEGILSSSKRPCVLIYFPDTLWRILNMASDQLKPPFI